MIPVAIFSRVSKNSQDYTRQISDLQTVAQRNKWTITNTITAKISGSKKKRKEREDMDELLELARSGTIKKVMISEVSRLGRRPAETYQFLEELSDVGVSVYVHNFGMETLLATGKRNPAAALIFAIFNELARTEIELLSERIKSGLAEARRKGVVIARPKGSYKSDEKLLEENPKVVKYLKQETYSIREIAKLSNVAPGTVMKVKKVLEAKVESEGTKVKQKVTEASS